MKTDMQRLSLLIVIIMSWGVVASAQDPAKVELFGGYSYGRQVGDARFGNPDRNGYEVSVTGYPVRWLGVEASYAEHFGDENVSPGVLFPAADPGGYPSYKIKTRLTSFMAGPKVAVPVGRLTPYAHVLLGGVRQKSNLDVVGFGTTEQSDTTFGFTIGGGVNFRLSDRFTVRLAQIDYMRAEIDFHEERTGVVLRSSTSPNQIRASIGVAFTF